MTRPPPILLDVESRSRADLKKIGGRLYWEDPTSEILCAVFWDVGAEEASVWRPGNPVPDGVRRALRGGARLGAHNAMGFDRFAVHRQWGVPLDHPWVDTSELARRAGLPGALDALGTLWLGLPKDKDASRFTRGLSTVRRPTKRTAHLAPGGEAISEDEWKTYTASEKRARGVLPEITSEALTRVVDYCISDVEILAHGWSDLESWEGVEDDVERVDRIINDRGVYFDRGLARALLACDEANGAAAVEREAKALRIDPAVLASVVSSPQQFTAATGAPNAQKETVASIAQEGGRAAHYARARQALASIARGKLEAGLVRCSADGRLRDSLRYYGAHTGRWSGRGIQPQNLPRPEDRFEEISHDELDDLAVAVTEGRHHATQPEIDLLLRATLCAPPGKVLVVEDFSGIEARALAWCADDWDALEVIESGRDPYRVMAATIFGTNYDQIGKPSSERTIGKMAELACGYGMGARKFEMQCGPETLRRAGVDAQEVVQAWRAQHAPIVHFWRRIERAFIAACEGRVARVDVFSFAPSEDGDSVAIFLPTGRPIVYNETKLSPGKYGPQASYRGLKGREHTYGGKLTENVIQALCRELLAHAFVGCEDRGLHPVLHVHDEIVLEEDEADAEEAREALHEEMMTLPEWAEGFPIGGAGFVGKRYRK